MLLESGALRGLWSKVRARLATTAPMASLRRAACVGVGLMQQHHVHQLLMWCVRLALLVPTAAVGRLLAHSVLGVLTALQGPVHAVQRILFLL